MLTLTNQPTNVNHQPIFAMLLLFALLVFLPQVLCQDGQCEGVRLTEIQDISGSLTESVNAAEECTALNNDGGYNVESLTTEQNECIRQVHEEKAKCCMMREMKTMEEDSAKKACFKKYKDSHTEVIRLSCQWHQHVKACMKGETTVPTHDEHTAAHDQVVADFNRYANLQHRACWEDVKESMEICMLRAGNGVAKFKICSGSSVDGATDAEQKWYNLVKHTQYMKIKKMQEGQTEWRECLENPPAEEAARYRRERARRHVHTDEENSEEHERKEPIQGDESLGRRSAKQSDATMFFW